MWVLSFFILMSTGAIGGIRIPIGNTNIDNLEMVPSASTSLETLQVQPIYYSPNEQSVETSETHHEVEVPTPATYLLPPSPDARNEYFLPPDGPAEQTDWYPIENVPQNQNFNDAHQHDISAVRTGKKMHKGQVFSVPIRDLLPPKENAPNDFIVVSPSVELELPIEEIDHTIKHPSTDMNMLRIPQSQNHFTEDSIPLRHISPPKYYGQKYKNPTKLYPKKYIKEFKPIPIPISQYSDGSLDEMPVARPVKVIIPEEIKNGYAPRPLDKDENSYGNVHELDTINGASKIPAQSDEPRREVPSEQDTSETNFRHPIRDTYSAPVRQIPQTGNPPKSDGKRTEFRMHGMKGPHSYQFGYDTGKGKNRQFRYEERDNDGHVRGHYGYVDRGGKMRVVNYDADPVHGFRAESPVEKDSE